MSKKRLVLIVVGFFLLLFSFFIISIFTNNPSKKVMNFEVTAPTNTPENDLVFLSASGEEFLMEKHENGKWTLQLSQSQLNVNDGQFTYRYTRNGHGYNSSEYLEPDTRETLRKATFKEKTVQSDTIKRWRWFPEGEVVRTTDLTPEESFLPRINGQEFLSGQIIEDLYFEPFRKFFDTTATHMKNSGYKFAEIDPPLQWVEENGVLTIKNLIEENPNYPDDETLKEEILALKKAGLTVMLGPQICCEELNFQNRTKDWWDSYFTETTNFLVHYAKLAEETGVEYLHYYIREDYKEVDAAERHAQFFREIRKVFSGKVGQGVWNFAQEPTIIPQAENIPWGNELDYFYVAIDHPISTKDSPTDDELKTGADKMLDGVRQLYDSFSKPVIVRTTYFNVEQTWKGNSFYSIADVPWTHVPENEILKTKYRQSATDLPRVINAYLRSMAERPWIIGYGQFGYGHWENPISPELSVRGKPTEDLWIKWNNLIYK